MSNEILALFAAETRPQNGAAYAPVSYSNGNHLWVRVVDVTDAVDELAAAQAAELPGEAFIDTVHLPIN